MLLDTDFRLRSLKDESSVISDIFRCKRSSTQSLNQEYEVGRALSAGVRMASELVELMCSKNDHSWFNKRSCV